MIRVPKLLLTSEPTEPTNVLQPGRYAQVRSGQADDKISAKYLQISVIVGRTTTGRNRPRATLDQLVKVRLLLRQPPESSVLRGSSMSHFLLDLRKPPPTLSALW